jgi:hypothetical protein
LWGAAPPDRIPLSPRAASSTARLRAKEKSRLWLCVVQRHVHVWTPARTVCQPLNLHAHTISLCTHHTCSHRVRTVAHTHSELHMHTEYTQPPHSVHPQATTHSSAHPSTTEGRAAQISTSTYGHMGTEVTTPHACLQASCSNRDGDMASSQGGCALGGQLQVPWLWDKNQFVPGANWETLASHRCGHTQTHCNTHVHKAR